MFRSVSLILGLFVLFIGNVWGVVVDHSHQIEHSHRGASGRHIHVLNHEHDGPGFANDNPFLDEDGNPTGEFYFNDAVSRHMVSADDFMNEVYAATHHDVVGHDELGEFDDVVVDDVVFRVPWIAGTAVISPTIDPDIIELAEAIEEGTHSSQRRPHSHERTHRHDYPESDPHPLESHTHTATHTHYHGTNRDQYHGNESHVHGWDGHGDEFEGLAWDYGTDPDDVHDNTPQVVKSDPTSSPQLRDEPQVIFLPPVHTGGGSSDLPKDVDADGDVDNDDLSALAMNFGETPEGDLERYDVDGDGDIDTDDFQQVQSKLGSTVNSAPAASLALQLERIKGLNINDPDFQQIIQLLERRLLEPPPKKTVLLANYPNPFNPETWIPYRLAKPADVTLTIYATNGQVVRTLALGHQPTGNYVNRGRAAYWDGKDAFGEPVASGVYFYTLTTDDFSATRKMLIAK